MTERILIVEDNPQSMRLVAMVLKGKGYSLLMATDGEEALAAATRERPDLIIMDMQLPKRSGFEVTRELKQMLEFRHVPIIAVTAYAMKGDEEKCLEAGSDAYLSKPIQTRELPGIIAELLRKHKKER